MSGRVDVWGHGASLILVIDVCSVENNEGQVCILCFPDNFLKVVIPLNRIRQSGDVRIYYFEILQEFPRISISAWHCFFPIVTMPLGRGVSSLMVLSLLGREPVNGNLLELAGECLSVIVDQITGRRTRYQSHVSKWTDKS